MRVFSNIEKCYTLQSVADAEGRASHSDALKAIESAVIVEDEGRIVWLGSHKDFEGQKSRLNLSRKTESISLAGTTVLPAFTECHTHLVFAGDRSGEFELRNQGVSYQEISKQGGGILSTVQATCEATESDLLRLAQQRADRFVQQGATALEVKSGYGLSHESEIKMLKVARAIRGPKVMATYLGPHSVPSGSSKTDYLEQILDRTLPEIAKLGVAIVQISLLRMTFSLLKTVVGTSQRPKSWVSASLLTLNNSQDKGGQVWQHKVRRSLWITW
jgi:imidazolonepropionase